MDENKDVSAEVAGDEVAEVIEYSAQIPSTKLEIDGDWPKGTILNINLSLRVRARTEGEDRKGNSTLHHHLAVEEAAIRSVFTPAQRRAQHEAALAAEKAEQDKAKRGKVIEEEPGHEDQQSAQADAAPAPEDWSDVDAREQERRDQLKVEGVEQTEAPTETDDHQFETVDF